MPALSVMERHKSLGQLTPSHSSSGDSGSCGDGLPKQIPARLRADTHTEHLGSGLSRTFVHRGPSLFTAFLGVIPVQLEGGASRGNATAYPLI